MLELEQSQAFDETAAALSAAGHSNAARRVATLADDFAESQEIRARVDALRAEADALSALAETLDELESKTAADLAQLQTRGSASTTQGVLTARKNKFGKYDYHHAGRMLTESQVADLHFWF